MLLTFESFALRLALRGLDDTRGATLATVMTAFGVALVAAAVHPDLRGAWPFLLAGVLAPGVSQILFTLAVREAGPSRASVVVGAAPLVAVTIALLFLHEPLRLPLVLGALLIVGGGLALATERTREDKRSGTGLCRHGGRRMPGARRP